MKKIGLTLDDNTYEYVKDIANLNNMTPTTICSLIIGSRIEFYEQHGFTPLFKKQYFEQCQKQLSEEERKELERIARTPWLEQDH